MNRLDPTLAQPRHHLVDIALTHTERDVVLGCAAVNDGVHTEEAKHPAITLLGIKKQRIRGADRAIAEFEPKFINVELDCAAQVGHREVHLVETVMQMSRHEA